MGQSLVVLCHCTADLKECMRKVHALKYAEEACYNGALIMKAFSSGADIGTCNWTVNGGKTNIAYIANIAFWSAAATNFDYHPLEQSDLIIYSDFSPSVTGNIENENNCLGTDSKQISAVRCHESNWREIVDSLLATDDTSEDIEKLEFICSCTISTIKDGGSVLVPIGRFGIMLQLLEQIADVLQSSNFDVPIFVISSVAVEIFAFFDIIPEWLCRQRQEKLYSGQPLFIHEELKKGKKLYLFPSVHSLELLETWEEPCIIFCPHWSLRLGPVVHLLQRWSGDKKSLLVLEEGVDADLALLPFKPILMKVLQYSLMSGISLQNIQALLRVLQPKCVLFPGDLKQHMELGEKSSSLIYYSEGETLHIPDTESSSEIEIATDLISQLDWINLKERELNIARLWGDLVVEQGKHRLIPGNKPKTLASSSRPLLQWGMPNMHSLLSALQKMEINATVEESCMDGGNAKSENAYTVHVCEPNKALIEVKSQSTVVSTADDHLASLISDAICSVLNGV